MRQEAGGVDALLDYARRRFYALRGNDEPGAAHSRDCAYEWMFSEHEAWLRIEGLGRELRETVAQAVSDAMTLRDEILALGFVEINRCEVSAARVEDLDDHETFGWRGRVDLGLRRLQAPATPGTPPR